MKIIIYHVGHNIIYFKEILNLASLGALLLKGCQLRSQCIGYKINITIDKDSDYAEINSDRFARFYILNTSRKVVKVWFD